MPDRQLSLIVLVAALLVGCGDSKPDAAQLEARLDAPDVATRVAAAEALLGLQPNRHDLRLMLAKHYLETGRFTATVHVLGPLVDAQHEQRSEAVGLSAEALCREIENISASVNALTFARAEPRLIKLIEATRSLAAQMDRDSVAAQIVEGRLLAAELLMHTQRVRDKQHKLDMAREAGVHENLGKFRTAVRFAEARRRDAENAVREACNAIARLDPDSAWPARLNLRLALWNDELLRVLDIAQQLANLPQLAPPVAAEAVLALLEHPDTQEGPLADEAMNTSERLMAAVSTEPVHDVAARLANARIALRRDDPHKARALAQSVLDEHSQHARARVILGVAHAHLGETDQAIKVLTDYMTEHPTAEAHLALGTVLLRNPATLREAADLLEKAAELNPKLVSARVRLAEAIAATGHIVRAREAIDALTEQAPDRPRVQLLSALLAVADDDTGPLLTLFVQRGREGELLEAASEAALIAAMTLDDTQWVGRLLTASSEVPRSSLLVVADSWRRSEPNLRAMIASILSRAAAAALQPRPMLQPLPPDTRIELIRNHLAADRVPGQIDPELLRACYFIPWPQDEALAVVEHAIERWPDNVDLHEARAQLHYWLGREDDARAALDRLWDVAETEAVSSTTRALRDVVLDNRDTAAQTMADHADNPTATMKLLSLAFALEANDEREATDQLRALLEQHPRHELAALWAMAHSINAGRAEQCDRWLKVVRVASADLSHITEGRLQIASGQHDTAARRAGALQQQRWGDAELRRRAAEIYIRAYIGAGRAEEARYLFGSSGTMNPHDTQWMWVVSLDALLATGHQKLASDMAADIRQLPKPAPWFMDAALHRYASGLSDPVDLLEMWTRQRPEDPLPAYYLAIAHIRADRLDDAEAVLASAMHGHPGSPRLLMLQARLAETAGRNDEARGIYESLLRHGGEVRAAADTALKQMTVQ